MMTQTISTPTVRTMPSVSAGRKDTALMPMWQTRHLTGFYSFLITFSYVFYYSFGVDGSNTRGRGGAQCRNDFVGIPGATASGHGDSVERWCGAVFGVLSAPGLHDGANQIITYRTPFR